MSKGVGIYIGRNEVIAVSAIRSPAGPQIKSFAVELIRAEERTGPSSGKETPETPKTSPESQAILRALEKIQEPGAFVNAAVSPLDVVTRNFIMPAVPRKEEEGAVHNEASRYIPFKLSESVLDYHANLTHRNVLSVTATVIRAEALATCLDDLRSASAKVLMVEPVYSAVSRVFGALRMLGKDKTYGFVVLQSDGNVNVTLASQATVYLSRDFLLTGKIEADKTRFYEELKASMDYFYKLTGGEAIVQIFLSGAGDLKVWVEHLEHAFNYTIRFDMANVASAQNIPQETFSVVLPAFGLALRSLGYPSPLGDVKLLPKAERRSDRKQLLTFLGLGCLAILVLCALIRLIAFQPYLMYLAAQNQAILGSTIQEDPAFASQSLEDLMVEHETLSARAGQLKLFFRNKAPDSLFMMSLGQGVPQSVSLDYISFEDANTQGSQRGAGKKRLNLRGSCFLGNAEKEAETVSGWMKSLAGKKVIAGYFSEIKLEELKREKSGTRDLTSFRVVGE
jgi:Tfp pilus assembly protein PilN